MKKFFKWTAIVFIALIVIGAVASTSEEEAVDQAVNEVVDETMDDAEKATASAEKEAEKDEGKMTKEKFDQIKNGMTYDEVVAIVGSEGNLISEVGGEGDQYYTVTYEWEGASFASNSNVTFQGNPVVVESKAQFGLE